MNIIYSNEDLFLHYGGQIEPQDIYLTISGVDQCVFVAESTTIGYGCSADEFNGRDISFKLPNLAYHAHAVNEFLDDNKELWEKMLESYSEKYDGQRYRGSFDEELVAECEAVCDEFEGADWCSIDDWLYGSNNDISGFVLDAKALGLDLRKDEDFDKFVCHLEEEVESSGIFVVGDISKALFDPVCEYFESLDEDESGDVFDALDARALAQQ